jgi:hypothetical protein
MSTRLSGMLEALLHAVDLLDPTYLRSPDVVAIFSVSK